MAKPTKPEKARLEEVARAGADDQVTIDRLRDEGWKLKTAVAYDDGVTYVYTRNYKPSATTGAKDDDDDLDFVDEEGDETSL